MRFPGTMEIFDKGNRADIEVLDMPLFITDPHRENPIWSVYLRSGASDPVYVMENRADFIRQRQAEGIAIAKAKWDSVWTQKNELPEEFNLYFEMWKGRNFHQKSSKDFGNQSGYFLSQTRS